MAIQILVTAFIAVVVGRLVQSVRLRRIAFSAAIGWGLLWISVGVIFWSPEIASRLAVAFGIGRGSDLVIYSAVIVIMYLVYRLFIRLEKIERDITKLTRTSALRDEQSSDHHPDTDS